jgi:hypothetical protein
MAHLISNASMLRNLTLPPIRRGEEFALKLSAKTGKRAVSNLRNTFEARSNRRHEGALLRGRQWVGCVQEDGLLVIA